MQKHAPFHPFQTDSVKIGTEVNRSIFITFLKTDVGDRWFSGLIFCYGKFSFRFKLLGPLPIFLHFFFFYKNNIVFGFPLSGLIEQRDSLPLLEALTMVGDWPVASAEWNKTKGNSVPEGVQ